MTSELANKLKDILDNMSQERFDEEWIKITELKLEGPSFVDIAKTFNSSTNNE